jgi:integrase
MLSESKKKELSFFDLYDKFLKDSTSGKRLQPNGKKITEGTIANYTYTKKLLQKFCLEKKFELRLRTIKTLTQRQMHTEKNYWAKFYKKFTEYLYNDCSCFDNYVGANIKNIRTFFGYLNKTLLLNVGDFHLQFYVRKEEIAIVTLLPEELNFLIYDKAFEGSLDKKFKKVKDVFVFGCTVALRFSDLLGLKKSNLRIVNNNWYLLVRSKKTSVDTQISLPDYAIEILKKYPKIKGGYLLPRYNITNLNIYVKQLTEKAGLTHNIGKTRGRRGDNKVIAKDTDKKKATYRFCDLVTTHTMRRTAITTMLCLGMPEQLVRKISGHSPMSKEFFRYVSLAQAYQDKETAMVFDKLRGRELAVNTNN